MAGRDPAWKGCRQVRARRDHTCCVCQGTIHKGHEYIVNKRQAISGDGWEERKRHIHCDALLRFYAEKMGYDPENVGHHEMRQFVRYLCDYEHIKGFHNRCGHNGFTCGEVLYILRYRPGYSAVIASAEKQEEADN